MEINEFLKIVPAVKKAPFKYLWSSYDPELYINFKNPFVQKRRAFGKNLSKKTIVYTHDTKCLRLI